MKYYLLDKNKKSKGPYELSWLREYWKAGKIPAGTRCCEKGGKKWLPIEDVIAVRPAALERKETFWQRCKGTIELVGALIAIGGLGYAGYQYLKPSEEKLPAEGQYALAHQYLEGNGTDKNIKRAGELLIMAAGKGHVKAIVDLGIFAKEGKAGQKKDYGEALKWFELAAEQGDGRALCEIGLLYAHGDGVEKDLGKALKYFRDSAEKGDDEGQFWLGDIYGRGVGVVQNYDESFKWYCKAAEQGNKKAQHLAGVSYQYGRGVTRDYTEALKWYRKAAEQGYPESQHVLGDLYMNGNGVVEKDEYEAVKWYRKAAEQGFVGAQINLGVRYDNGQGVKQDDVEAVKWYRRAAEQRNFVGQYNLGVMYAEGAGVEKDESEALQWIGKAAEQGYATAQTTLGFMYANGQGVKQDREEAVKWYMKAAIQGNAKAQYEIGRLSLSSGSQEGMQLAFVMWAFAIGNGFMEAKKDMENLFKNMTPKQIAKAEALAKEMIETSPKLIQKK